MDTSRARFVPRDDYRARLPRPLGPLPSDQRQTCVTVGVPPHWLTHSPAATLSQNITHLGAA